MLNDNRTILLVEDEAIIALAEKSILEKHGYHVLIARDGEMALAAVGESREIDLILMDIDLGIGSDGTVVAELILREHDLPIVFLSSHTEPEIVERTEGITSYGYIVKNTGETVLLASIRMAFRLFEAKQDARMNEKRFRDTAEYLAEAQAIARLGRWDYYHAERRLKLSDTMYDMLRIDPLEYTGSLEALFDSVHPNDLSRVNEAWDQSLRDLLSYSIEYRILPPDAGQKWLVTKVWVVPESADEPLHSVGVVQDISDRKQTEHELQEVDDRFRVLFDNAPLGYQSLDADGRFLEVNSAWLEMLGYSRDDVIGKWFGDFLDSESVDAFRDRFSRFKERGQIDSEFFMRSNSGRRIFVGIAGRIGTNPDGSFKQTHCILKNETDRHNAELAVVQSESLHREIIASIEDVIVIIDRNGINRFKSPNIERIFGWKPEEVVGAPALEKVHPEDRAGARTTLAALISTPEGRTSIECRYQCKDGTYRWIEFTGTNRLDDPRFKGILGSYRDISVRKETDEALRASLVELEKSQRAANVGNWIWHIKTGDLKWSDQMYRIFGIDRESFTGNLSEVFSTSIHPEDREKVEESNLSVVTQKAPIPIEYRVIRPDGQTRVVWADAGELELDLEGEPALLRGIVHDITDRKRAEESLRKSEEILSKSEQLSRSGAWEWDLTTDQFSVSAGWQRVHGAWDQTVSRTDLMPIAHPDDRSRVEDAFQRCVELDEPYDLEHRIIRRDDGELRVVHARGEAVRDSSGRPIKVTGAVVDITESAEEKARIARLVREKDTLLKETNHRVKNGFMTVESLLCVHAESAGHPEAAAALRVAQSRIASMTSLYETLLQAGDYRDVSASDYLGEVTSRAVAAIHGSEEVHLDTEIEDIRLKPGCAFSIGAIVAELAANSIKHARGPDVATDGVAIKLTLEQDSDDLILRVTDNGLGLSTEFEPATTTRFGFMLVRTLADQMNGYVQTDSPEGAGLRTTVRLPVCDVVM